MQDYRLIILSILILISSDFYGQETKKKYRKLKRVSEYQLVLNNDTINTYYISENPITNKEYITYLCWIADVYEDYPKIFLNSFPRLNKNYIDSLLSKDFTPIKIRTLVNKDFLTKHYMFNPKYLDFPVMGITWNQSMKFLNWLSDRYNESILLKKGFQDFYPSSQINEYNFNTESYLFEQYEGIIGKLIMDTSGNIRPVNWNDRLLIPSFRLPSCNEILISENIIQSSLKPYKSNKFLNSWIKYYLKFSDNQLTLQIDGNNYFSFKSNVTLYPENYNTIELTLDYKTSVTNNSIIEIFSDLNQNIFTIQVHDSKILKDSLGHMPFIIISENENLNPIFIERSDYPNNKESLTLKDKYSIFRYALCGIKE